VTVDDLARIVRGNLRQMHTEAAITHIARSGREPPLELIRELLMLKYGLPQTH
jgi:hypothetical protein